MTSPHLHPQYPDADATEVLAPRMEEAAVVIIDDRPVNVDLLQQILAGDGITATGFTDAREAIAHCACSSPDLVLLDLHMPELDGFGVLEALQESTPPSKFLPVLVVTADDSGEVRERALAAGAKDFLSKPLNPAEVLLRVKNLLETGSLYRSLEQHNAELRSQLDAERRGAGVAAADERRRHESVVTALTPGGLSMVFQPVIDIETGATVGVEALARFPDDGDRGPDQRFAEADAIGLGVELELVAARSALASLGDLPEGIFLALNVSPSTVLTVELHDMLAASPADRIVLELTEHVRVHDYDVLVSALDRLRGLGTRIAADDAGAGYAGLHHILRVRPDILKLDVALVRGIDEDPVRRSLAGALVVFASDMGAVIVAEGVESRDELRTLQAIGIPWAQGYHLARPEPLPLVALERQLFNAAGRP